MFPYASVIAQENANLKNGYAAQGHDVVAYFQYKATTGNVRYQHPFEGIKYKFNDDETLIKFQRNPEKYVPQYGGFCAYAIAKNGKKVGVNPKTFTISDGKLYLFLQQLGNKYPNQVE